MGIMVFSLLWVVQDLYHQQYSCSSLVIDVLISTEEDRGKAGGFQSFGLRACGLGLRAQGLGFRILGLGFGI